MADRESNKELPTEVILDSISDGVFTVDENWRVTSFNHAAEEITGIPREEALGRRCWEVFRANICEEACPLKETVNSGKPSVSRPVYIIRADGSRIPISVSTSVLRDEAGNVAGGVETFRDLSLVEALRKEVTKKYAFRDIISRNHRMRAIFDILPRIAESGSTVLIEGESGTGKELLARALHDLSPRKDKPLVTLNCGALPDTLLESELFGHKAGAFTDARKDKPGRFEIAEGGTLFLDEIGDISPALQVRLLRVLQEKTYEPLGGTEVRRADVRIVTATHQDLEAMVEKGSFRTDLFYRINVVRLQLPPLRERMEDLPLLVESFVEKFSRLQGKDVTGVSPEAMQILMSHDWPGNVRELENAIEHAFVLCAGGQIEAQHLPDSLRGRERDLAPTSTQSTLKEVEARLIHNALEQAGGNRQEAARALGIHKSTLFRKIKALGILPPEKDGRTRS